MDCTIVTVGHFEFEKLLTFGLCPWPRQYLDRRYAVLLSMFCDMADIAVAFTSCRVCLLLKRCILCFDMCEPAKVKTE